MNNRNVLIALLFTLLVPTVTHAQNQELKVDDIFSGTRFTARSLPEHYSMQNGNYYTLLNSEHAAVCIIRYAYKTGAAVDTLFNASKALYNGTQITPSGYAFSSNEKQLLLETETESIYRHSTKANYFVYDIAKNSLTPVSLSGKQQYAQFSPDGMLIAFVRENNLYIKDIAKNSEIMVTRDGKQNAIINGATDWVYEEEFSFDRGFQWSLDGTYIAYYRFDESQVKEFELTYYGNLYPETQHYKYPKAGEVNSTVSIFIYNLSANKTIKADANKEADQYIPRIKWTTDPSKLCIVRMNRLQNHLELLLCDAASGSCSTLFTEDNKSYLEITDDLTFLSGNKEFIWTSSGSGFKQIFLYGMDGRLIRQITNGKYDVTAFYGYNPRNDEFYYQADGVNPMSREVYATNRQGKTRILSQVSGISTATFSANFNYCFITRSTIGVPPTTILYTAKGKSVRTVEENNEVKDALKNFKLSDVSFFNFTTTEGISLNGWMIKPKDFDPQKKYPVIQFMYGGPGSQTVVDCWSGYNLNSKNYLWFQLLAQKGYIIVSVDNRGTGGRGEAFTKCTYRQLGHFETIDQIETAKWLAKQPYVDGSRIGAWGWSFGGYMTSLLITKGADYFKTAVAVAPVTNWRFYDTIYTERYLQKPSENTSGYEDNSPVNFAGMLKGNFLLIHGGADDNVHVQNTMEFVTALVNEHKQFEQFIYPNKAHGIGGVRVQLFQMMTNYFIEKL
ncbi:MAG TPA: S9 family peptidase [Bacteroidia bacterium]|nr:S9 family peptidase [Bacteroidia bacterium]